LFRKTDPASRQIAARLKCDLGGLDIDASPYFEEDEDDCSLYPYWGTRLLALLEEINSADRTSAFQKKVRMKLRKKLMVIFSMLAVVVGIIGIVYQTREDSKQSRKEQV